MNTIQKHSLGRGLVITLTKFGEAVHFKGENKIHYRRDLHFDTDDDFSYKTNLQKLRYFGLIHHYKNSLDEFERGYWLLTSKGADFLKSYGTSHTWVKTLNNIIVERSIDEVFIKDIWKDYAQDLWQSLWLGERVETVEQPRQLTFAGLG